MNRRTRVLVALGALASCAGCAERIPGLAEGGGGGQGGSAVTPLGSGGEAQSGGGPADAGADVVPPTCSLASDCAALDGACALGACINGTCGTLPANELGACEDGSFCTDGDRCEAGVCVAGAPRICPTSSECFVASCDESADACTESAGNDGGSCDDDDPCSATGFCDNGSCLPATPVDCSFLDGPCAIGVCDADQGCTLFATNDGAACEDGLFCTVSEVCTEGTCTGGAPNPCAPPGGCFVASCDELNNTCSAAPGNDGQACDDADPCTTATTCLAGACTNGAPDNEGLACDDATACTTGESCSAGVCGGGVGPAVYFSDDFAADAKGWTLGPEWEIGPAKASSGGSLGADPDADHSPTADDGIAGVVIGGNASTGEHGFYYLESPPFDTSAAAGPVILGFWRWLNSDYPPYMENVVEVYDGTSWVNLWTSTSPAIQDSPPAGLGWTFIEHDLTAHKNASMRVRFGFDIGSSGVYTIGSWNVDDVLVAAAACP